MLRYPLIALAMAAFGIGTTEFVIMGLLPNVAQDLAVSIPSAGMLVTSYALSVALGAPIMALATARFQRKTTLIILMGIFIAGNACCALAGSYWSLMAARIITALCHGAFFGIGSVEAASLVPENRKASAVALMFTGLTLANVLGVPVGTAIGQQFGWRMTFWGVTAIGCIAFAALLRFLPRDPAAIKADMKSEIRALNNQGIWISLLTTILFSASMFTTFTYIAPILQQVTQISPRRVTGTLFLIGLGLTIGNVIGGRLADWRLIPALVGIFIVLTINQILFSYFSRFFVPAEITLFFWGGIAFASVSGLQVNVVNFARKAPNLIATLNIGAFNVGNALGAFVGGVLINRGLSLTDIPLAAAALAFAAVLTTLYSARLSHQKT